VFITGQVVEVTTPALSLSGVALAQEVREVGWGGDGGGSSELDTIEELLLKLRERKSEENKQRMSTRGSQQNLTGASLEVVQSPRSSAKGGDYQSLATTVSMLSRQVATLQSQSSTQQQQISALQTQNSLLTSVLEHEKSESVAMKGEMAALKSDNTALKAAGKKDRDAVTLLERKVASLRDKLIVVCQDQEQLRSDLTNTQADLARVQEYTNTLQVHITSVHSFIIFQSSGLGTW
jgi:chromosome segregation ATPase